MILFLDIDEVLIQDLLPAASNMCVMYTYVKIYSYSMFGPFHKNNMTNLKKVHAAKSFNETLKKVSYVTKCVIFNKKEEIQISTLLVDIKSSSKKEVLTVPINFIIRLQCAPKPS